MSSNHIGKDFRRKCSLKQFVVIYIIINSVMARKSETKSRVDLWQNYRNKIAKDFMVAEKKRKVVKAEPKVTPSTPPKPTITRAEALIKEYEKKKGKEEQIRKGPNPFIVFLTSLLFIALVAGIIYLIWRYYT